MKTFTLNIFSSPQDFTDVLNELERLLTNKLTYSIILMRNENETPENPDMVINVEYQILGSSLFSLTKKYSNLTFSNTTDWDNSHIMNKIVIVKK